MIKVYVKLDNRLRIDDRFFADKPAGDRTVLVSDIAEIYCHCAGEEDNSKEGIENSINNQIVCAIPEDRREYRRQYSIIYIIELIKECIPEAEVESMGENSFYVYYRKRKDKKVAILAKILLICVITFFGSGYAIIAYNNDVDSEGIFELMYSAAGADEYKDSHIMEIMYSLGLTTGIIVFYNHFAGKKLSSSPTPLQVEINKYEEDVDDTIVNCLESEREEN